MIARRARNRPRRRGSAYLIVLAVAMIVALIGAASLALGRIRLRTSTLEQDWHAAGVSSIGAVDKALTEIAGDPWWRTVNRDYEATFTPEVQFGNAWLSWRYEDLNDDDLDDEAGDPLRIHGRARIGHSTRVYSVIAMPTGISLDVLRTAVHASGDLDATGVLDVRNGPVSANGTVTCDLLLGDVEATSCPDAANVSGSVTTPAPPKVMPSAAIWEYYKSSSRELKFSDLAMGVMEHVIVSPGHNPYRPQERSADGLYRVKVPANQTFKVRRSRIEATLLVELLNGAKLEIDDDVVMQPARSHFPALIVYTSSDVNNDVRIRCRGELDEFDLGVNFNPPHTPWFGISDSDTADAYPASITGLVHVIRDVNIPVGETRIEAPNRIIGCIIADGNVVTDHGTILVANPTLLSQPPLGYATTRAGTNLLDNGDMEAGLTGWSPVGAPTVLASEGSAHTAAACIKVKDRNTASHGIAQDVTSSLVSGTSYDVDLWLEMRSDPESAEAALQIVSTADGTQWFTIPAAAIDTDWTRVTGILTPTWEGDLTNAKLVVRTETSNQDFLIDDCVLAPSSADLPPARLATMPGTWCAESAAP